MPSEYETFSLPYAGWQKECIQESLTWFFKPSTRLRIEESIRESKREPS